MHRQPSNHDMKLIFGRTALRFPRSVVGQFDLLASRLVFNLFL